MVELEFAGGRLEATSEEDFFSALATLREDLEAKGILLVCYGASKNVYPSPMSRSMGYGERAYRLKLGRRARSEDLVSIFESGPDVVPATLEEQEAYYEEWLNSLE